MALNNIEIEIQLQVEDSSTLKKFLTDNASKIIETSQRDEYYTPAHKNYLDSRPVLEWLRIRQDMKGASICFKNWHEGDSYTESYCEEWETSVGSFDTAKSILQAMGCTLLTVVDKKRVTWKWNSWEVSIDYVDTLGEFVEIEYAGNTAVDPKMESESMIQFLKKQKCGKMTGHSGYPFLLLFPEEREGVEL